jgi:hypothetical protein
MGFLIRVEEAGHVVEEVVADRAFDPVRHGLRSAEFPLLGSLDPYGDTFLDPDRCGLLETEIRGAGGRLEAGGGCLRRLPQRPGTAVRGRARRVRPPPRLLRRLA